MADDGELLVVLLETHPVLWESNTSKDKGGTWPTFLEQILIFLNCYLLLNASNELVVYAVHDKSWCVSHERGSSQGILELNYGGYRALEFFVYNDFSESYQLWNKRKCIVCLNDILGQERFWLMNKCLECPILHKVLIDDQTQIEESLGQMELASTALLSAFKGLLEKLPNEGKGGAPLESALSAALSRALCFIHRQRMSGNRGLKSTKPRILVFTASPDTPVQYIPTMNAIFSAQRANVIIDACYMGSNESSFLQQASHITGGVFLHPARGEVLLQYLNTVFASDSKTRSMLKSQISQGVNFKASCFCHKKPIDLAFVCSVCLSVFCRYVIECPTCGTEFSTVSKKK